MNEPKTIRDFVTGGHAKFFLTEYRWAQTSPDAGEQVLRPFLDRFAAADTRDKGMGDCPINSHVGLVFLQQFGRFAQEVRQKDPHTAVTGPLAEAFWADMEICFYG